MVTPELLSNTLRELGVVSVKGECRFPCPSCQPDETDPAEFKATVNPGSKRLLVARCFRCCLDREGSRRWWGDLVRLFPILDQVAVSVEPAEARRLWSATSCGYSESQTGTPTADPDTLHAVYSDLLDHLDLSERHGLWLEKRGLDRHWAHAAGYRSTPDPAAAKTTAAAMWLRWGFRLKSVPGFASVFGDQTRILFCDDAILTPCRDTRGRLTALKHRRMQSGKWKLRLLSSKAVGGPRAVSGPHTPLGTGGRRWDRVWVTEGERKADVLWTRRGEAVVGVPGVGSWRRSIPVVEELAEAGATVVLAFDQDASGRRCNRVAAAEFGKRWSVVVAEWSGAKGIDDAVVKGVEVSERSERLGSPQLTGHPPPQPRPRPLSDYEILPWLRRWGPVRRSLLQAHPVSITKLIRSGAIRVRLTREGQILEAGDVE